VQARYKSDLLNYLLAYQGRIWSKPDAVQTKCAGSRYTKPFL